MARSGRMILFSSHHRGQVVSTNSRWALAVLGRMTMRTPSAAPSNSTTST